VLLSEAIAEVLAEQSRRRQPAHGPDSWRWRELRWPASQQRQLQLYYPEMEPDVDDDEVGPDPSTYKPKRTAPQA
jgi:hypothetical protein